MTLLGQVRTQSRRRRGRTAHLVGICLILASCGGTSTSSTPKVDLASVKCEAQPEAGLGEGEVCVDTGIRPQSLFSFSNWGGRRYKSDDFGFTELIALYGEKEVCGTTGQDACETTPKARLIRDAINGLLQNGRCEGLSALGALYMTSRGPDPKTFGAGSVRALSPSVDSFADIIDYWWATQFLGNVQSASKETRNSDMRRIIQTVLEGLSTGKGVTLGLYASAGAHSVLPVAVTRSSNSSYVIHVWDSNNPNVLGQVAVDLDAGSWRYSGGRVNTGTAADEWSGGKGSIDAVALDARNGTPVLDVNDTEKGSASITASSPAGSTLELTVTTKDGAALTSSSTGTSGAIPGAEATPLRTGDANQVVVSLTGDVGDYSVAMRVAGNVKGSAQMVVDSGGTRALSVSAPIVTGTTSATVDVASDKGSGSTAFSVASPQAVSVSASTDDSILGVPVGKGETLTIDPSNNQGIDSVVTLDPAAGAATVLEIKKPTSGSTQEVVVVRTVDGTLTPVTKALDAVAVNRDVLDSLVSTADSAAGQVKGSAAQETPTASVSAEVSSTAGVPTDESVVITSSVTSDNPVSSWVEFGPDADWSSVTRTSPKSVAEGLGVENAVTLGSLLSGTVYRFRSAVESGGFVTYSPWNTFTTSGQPLDEFAIAVSDDNVKVASSLVAVTPTGGVVAARVTTPVASTMWIEYALDSNTGDVLKTQPQNIRKSSGSTVVAVINGLTTGQKYRYRVVVKAQGATGYSSASEFTTGLTVATERLALDAILPDFSFSISAVTSNSALVDVSVTGTRAGRLQVETFESGSSNGVRTKAYQFAAGKSVRVSVPLEGLKSSTRYVVRVLLTVGTLTGRSVNKQITTLDASEGDTSGGRLDPPAIPTSSLRETTATFTAVVRSEAEGTVTFEYGVDNSTGFLYTSVSSSVTAGSVTVGPVQTSPVLRAGTPYRVRSVLVIGDKTYRSAYSTFVTTGTLDPSDYTAKNVSLRRNSTGVDATWSVTVSDIPGDVSFTLMDGATIVCTATNGTQECSGAVNNYGTRTMVVVTYMAGKVIARGESAQINIGGTPTVNSFASVTTTSTSITFQYSFDPQGETVQYGIEVRTPSDQFVKADLGGSTSTARNGAVQVVSGLSPSTTYRLRLVLVYGSVTKASDWLTITTS